MSAYLLGNLFGRLAVSYALVWLVLWAHARFGWRDAFRRTHHWAGLAAVVTIWLLGLIASRSGVTA